MSILKNKNVLLGISGGIAAYKIPYLVRLLRKKGVNVKVIMTPAAKEFVSPLTLSTLSTNEVHSTLVEPESENEKWVNHVDLALWADYFIIAPVTANTLSKMSNGICDNLLIACYLSSKCPVFFAPAMDLDMYKHASTKKHIAKLQSFNHILIPPTAGELASGLTGEGRMEEPERIVAHIENKLLEKAPFYQKKVLITAGPTYELIDPVRFIGNHASGKMGFEIAEKAAELGAEVTLVMGPSALKSSHPSVNQINITQSEEMYEQVHAHYKQSDIVIMSAAVADFRPKEYTPHKIKKEVQRLSSIELVKTKDILASLGEEKEHQFLVGFALETNDEIENAKKKLVRKNLDLIVLNSLNDKGAGFKKDTNKVTIINKAKEIQTFRLKSKSEVATDILNEICSYL